MTWYYIHIAPSLYGIREREKTHLQLRNTRKIVHHHNTMYIMAAVFFNFSAHYQERGNGRINNLSALHNDISAPTLEIFRCPTVTPSLKSVPWVPREMEWDMHGYLPAPTPIEPGGTYAHSPSPEPPYLGKRISKEIPPYLGYWLPLALTKKHPLFLVISGNLPENTAKKYPPFPRKWERACGPLCIRVGGYLVAV